MYATQEHQADLRIEIDERVQERWMLRIENSQSKVKLDDVGDSMLHALNPILCGSGNFRQLVPASSSVNNNRSVAIAVCLELVIML